MVILVGPLLAVVAAIALGKAFGSSDANRSSARGSNRGDADEDDAAHGDPHNRIPKRPARRRAGPPVLCRRNPTTNTDGIEMTRPSHSLGVAIALAVLGAGPAFAQVTPAAIAECAAIAVDANGSLATTAPPDARPRRRPPTDRPARCPPKSPRRPRAPCARPLR